MKMTIQVLLHLKHWNFKEKNKIQGIVNNCFINRGPHVYITTLFDYNFQAIIMSCHEKTLLYLAMFLACSHTNNTEERETKQLRNTELFAGDNTVVSDTVA
jgi:hypothetical protein